MSLPLPARLYRCRIDEVGPLAQMVRSAFVLDAADFVKLSPDFGAAGFLPGFNTRYDKLEQLVPTAIRRAIDAQVTRTMHQVSKDLREPLNFLEVRLNRAAKKKPALTVLPKQFGIGAVRAAIASRDMETLDGKLKTLIGLVTDNKDQLKSQGHTDADTQVLTDARLDIGALNVTQNDNDNATLVLTEENVTAANAMWELIDEITEAGRLMYKQTKPRKAVAYTLARLKKRMRQERAEGDGGGNGGGAAPNA